MRKYDIIILGAGAAGLSAAAVAVKRKKSVAVIDIGDKPGRKIAVSGGGRCNFTNMAASHNRYFGQNPNFVRSAIARIRPDDILNWVYSHNIKAFEKTPGQWFSKDGAYKILYALLKEICDADLLLNTNIIDIEKISDTFVIQTSEGKFAADSVIVATGGVSYPNLVVSDIGYKIAKKFGHKIIPPCPALGPLVLKNAETDLAGISVKNVEVKVGKTIIRDDMLFTHNGVGGPAIYKASIHINNHDMTINLLPEVNVFEWLKKEKNINGKKSVSGILATKIPAKIAQSITKKSTKNIADYKDIELKEIADKVNCMYIPKGDVRHHGMATAEVTRGGVSTDKISSKTMESELCKKLYFAGEVLDITGDLGGFNLHWAFASGRVAGQNA